MRVLVEGVVLVAVALISTFALAVTDVVQGAENQIAARMLRQPVLDWCNLSLATNRDKPNKDSTETGGPGGIRTHDLRVKSLGGPGGWVLRRSNRAELRARSGFRYVALFKLFLLGVAV